MHVIIVMAYAHEKSLEGNTVLNILYHDWKERTGGCLCCWFLGGKFNRNHVITLIFLPYSSVAFPKYLVYLPSWCFLCYHRLPGLVIHYHLKKGTFFSVLQMPFLIRKTDLWSVLFPFHSLHLSVCCILFSMNVAVGQTLCGWGSKGVFQRKHCSTQRQTGTSLLPPFETKQRSKFLVICQWVELHRLQVYTVESHLSAVLVQFN